ncbi:amidohydrolase family protein [Chloroflexota bacterium]
MSAEKEQVKVIKGKRLIDGNGGEPIQNAIMVIEGQRIKEVGSEGKVSVPAGAEVIDMGDCILMPGLIDCMMNGTAIGEEFVKNRRVAAHEVPPQLQELYGLFHCQVCFESGFTTLMDTRSHGSMYGVPHTAEMVAVRDAINNGLFAGPRILAGGIATITNAHLTWPRSYVKVDPETTADGPWELRKMVRRQLRMQCDFIKTCASSGAGAHGEELNVKNMTQEETDAIVDECHAFGKLCSCHCFTAESQKRVVKAGMDIIYHIVSTDDEAIAMIKEANTPVIPTLVHRTTKEIEYETRSGASDDILNKRRIIHDECFDNFEKMYQAGVRIAMGTSHGLDSGTYEIELYVNHGMTPMEAIQTATKSAAEAIWLGKDTGTLDVGKFADVIVVNGDPLADIRILQDRQNIRMVMKEGTVYIDKREGHEKSVIQNWNWKIVD